MAEREYRDVGAKNCMISETTGKIPRTVTPQCYAWSNKSGFFYKMSQQIQGNHLWEQRRYFGTTFASYFLRKKKHLSPIVGSLSTAPVKKSGLSLLNPVTSANKKYPSFQWASTELIWAVTGEVIFPTPITFWRSGKKSTMNRKSGWCQWHQTQGFNQGLQYHQQEPYPTRQQEKVPGWIYEVLW